MVDLADDNVELDITHARTTLGWEPKFSVAKTLPKMIAALKADPFSWYRENDLNPPRWLRNTVPTGDLAKELEPHELMRLGEEVHSMINVTIAPTNHMEGGRHGDA